MCEALFNFHSIEACSESGWGEVLVKVRGNMTRGE